MMVPQECEIKPDGLAETTTLTQTSKNGASQKKKIAEHGKKKDDTPNKPEKRGSSSPGNMSGIFTN